MMLSDVCLSDVCLSVSVAYIGPKSRTERPRKTKIGTEVAHVTRDSDTIFKVKRSTGRFTHRGVAGLVHQSLDGVAPAYLIDDCRLPSVVVRTLDLQSTGRGFDSRPPHCQVATLDKSFTRALRL